MDTYDIEEVIKRLKKHDKERIIEIFAPLINNVIKNGDSYENLSSKMNECGIEFDGEQIKKIVTPRDSQKINLNTFSTEILNTIQDIENRIIFNNSSSGEYIKRAQSSVFKNYNSSSKSSLTIRQVALNLCEKYSSRIEMYHNYKEIRFGSKSSISQMSESIVSVWLDSTDAKQLIGYSWKNNINSFLDIIAFKISTFHEIQVAILPPPFDALHVKIL